MGRTTSRKVVSAEPLDGFTIRATFDNGVVKEYDLMGRQGGNAMFSNMDEEAFASVQVDRFGRGVVWDDATDLAAHELYANGKLVDGKRRQTIVWLDPPERDALETYASERRMSLSEAIRDMIRTAAAM